MSAATADEYEYANEYIDAHGDQYGYSNEYPHRNQNRDSDPYANCDPYPHNDADSKTVMSLESRYRYQQNRQWVTDDGDCKYHTGLLGECEWSTR